MSILDGDGTGDPTYAEALVALAQSVNLGTAEKNAAIVRAIQREHDILPPEPELAPGTPGYEAQQLRKQMADQEARMRDQEAELAALRAQATANAAQTPAVTPAVTPAPAPGPDSVQGSAQA